MSVRRQRSWTWLWILLAAVALLWPSHLSGPLDGIPLESVRDSLLLGLVFPILCWLHPSFLNDRRARAVVIALVAWKAVTTSTLAQDGWCVSMAPSRPYVRNQTGKPHSWDLRADWRNPDPPCTAIMTRAYTQIEEFPVWFFNLPGADGEQPKPGDWPPEAITGMTVTGTLTARASGRFQVVTSPEIHATTSVDGQRVDADSVMLQAGSHAVIIEATLTGNNWQFQPTWNGGDLWSRVIATTTRPSSLDTALRPWGAWVSAALAGGLLIAWTIAALARVFDPVAFAWAACASGVLALLVTRVPEVRWHYVVALLCAAALLPIRHRLRNLVGAFILIGVPWFVMVAVARGGEAGRMTLYTAGNDWWTFQRFAYRIFLQGYWLEGGETTFWFQPLYRWIAGALHLAFGDSSIGERYWDAAGLAAMTLFSFHVTKVAAGFRWGLVAAGLTLALFMAGPGFIFVGHGLSEISSAGFIYLGALLALRSRNGSWAAALAAGVCATLGSWTRLNNLPMAAAIILFAWPISAPVKIIRRPLTILNRVSRRTLVVVPAVLLVGFVLFAFRTQHYTGTFSVFRGTAMDKDQGTARRAWQPGMSVADEFKSSLESVLTVLTGSEPPRIHNGSVPLIAGAVIALAALTTVAPLGDLPFSVVLFCLASLAGSVVARGTAYTGRFSIHVIGASTAVLVCAMSQAAMSLAPIARRLSLWRGRPRVQTG